MHANFPSKEDQAKEVNKVKVRREGRKGIERIV